MQATDDGVTTMRFAAMAGEAELTVAGRAPDRRLLDAAAAEVRRIEQAYSRYRADSLVSRINAAAGSGVAIEVDAETAGLLDFAARLHAQSDGLFDITSGILRRAWDFRSGRLPEPSALAALCARIGWRKVDWQPATRQIALTEPGMELDFGGFGKEYAADRAAAVLQTGGIQSGYVNLGGDLRVLGPRLDGRGWALGIRHPRADGTLAGVELKSGALATSGDYERYLDIAGRRYCHLLDPRSGWPVQHWQSVSVIAPVCLAAGALSTVAMLKGADAPAFLAAQQVPWLAVDASGAIVRHGF
ncbi:FAD:protein FMN transferase [Nevskia sp.]|uniref:FAD:protein FMN transferase n=1 Tax=Nevskia sp. TaxID=1929292 RepID=UPI003F719E9B